MKKVILSLLLAVVSMGAFAQFEQGTKYANLSLTGFGMNYSKAGGFNLGLDATGGYFVADSWMVLGQFGWSHMDGDNVFGLGAGARYYIVQNGLYLGAGLKFKHADKNYNDLLPSVQLGYAFFLGRTVTLEPELYFDISTKKFDYTCYGLRVGIGVYLFKDQYMKK